MILGCASMQNRGFIGDAMFPGLRVNGGGVISQNQPHVRNLIEVWRELTQNKHNDETTPSVKPARQTTYPEHLADSQDHAQSRPAASILVVEDEPIVALDLQHTLERMGYSVVGIATSGSEALQQTRIAKPDLILMDIQLSDDMDGIETAMRIGEQFGATAIIYLTAQTDENTLQRARETNPSDLLSKPFAESWLKATIEAALGDSP
jgi:two-component system, response regulator PdtaR